MAKNITDADLRRAERSYQTARERSELRREARNLLVRQALGQGFSHARIAAATGLTRGRVGQLALDASADDVAA